MDDTESFFKYFIGIEVDILNFVTDLDIIE